MSRRVVVVARSRRSNDALRTLNEEAGWTNHSFADAVNRVGAEAGVTLHYDRTTVSHWLAGSRPRPPVPGFIAEALSRRLGRPVLVTDAGFGGTNNAAPPLDGDGVAAMLHLAKADLDPASQSLLRRQPYQLDWTVTAGTAATRATPRPCGHEAAIRTMTTTFTTVYDLFGGGHARAALTAYLATDLPTWLYPRGLLGEAARLTHLNGLMCFDNLHHSLAQRYFHVARRLAVEAADPTVQAVVLHAMSTQAGYLGHHLYAIRMAEHAVTQAVASPAVRAAALCQAAAAHAAASNPRTAMTCLQEAEKYAAKATALTGEELSDLADTSGRALASLGDLQGAEKQFRDALRLRPAAARRPRMLTTHRMAEVQLRRGHLDAACTNWQQFLSDYPAVYSAQAEAAVTTIRRHLLPHSRNPTARKTLQLIHDTMNPQPAEPWPRGIPQARPALPGAPSVLRSVGDLDRV